MKDEDVVVTSPLSRDFIQDGKYLKINIYRGTCRDDDWMLEVVDVDGHSYVLGEMFVTDQAALEAAMSALHTFT
jgi:hypothetical protein